MSGKEPREAPLAPPKAPKRTAVYVTGLPEDVTVDELSTHFSKVGVIMNDMFTGIGWVGRQPLLIG